MASDRIHPSAPIPEADLLAHHALPHRPLTDAQPPPATREPTRPLPAEREAAVTELSVTTAIAGDHCVLTVTGDIDMTRSESIGDLGIGTLESSAIRVLAVDLSAVPFIDSTGLAALVRMHQAAVTQSKLLVLRNPSNKVRKMLNLTALDTVLAIEGADMAQLDSAR